MFPIRILARMFSPLLFGLGYEIDKILNTEADISDAVLSRLSTRLDDRFAQRAQPFVQQTGKSYCSGKRAALEASKFGDFTPILISERRAGLAEGLIVNEIKHHPVSTRICDYLSSNCSQPWVIVMSLVVCMVVSCMVLNKEKRVPEACTVALLSVFCSLGLVDRAYKYIPDLYEYYKEKMVLSIIKDFHWAEVGLLVVGAALQVEDMDSDGQQDVECDRLLWSMNALSKVILQLKKSLGTEMEIHAKLKKSIHLIVKGAILCCSQQPQIREASARQRLQVITRDINFMVQYFRGTIGRYTVENSSSYTDQHSQIELENSSTYRRQEQQIQRYRETLSFSRVREDIRRFQPKSYNPERVGFGLHHELNPYSTEIGEKKVLAICTTIKRLKGMTIANLLGEIQNSIIRNCYIDITASFPEEILVRNIVLDACFILEFLRASNWFLDHDVEKEIMIDIFKLENQAPLLFVLTKILELEFQTPEQAITELARILCMQPQFAIFPFYLKPTELEILQAEIEEIIKEQPCHLLHLLSKVVEAFLKPSNIPMNDTDADIVNNCMNFMSSLVWRNVNILQKFVIRFEPSKNGEVQFKKRWFGSVVYLPQIFIFKDTKSLLWNLIAFEDQYGESKIISKFIIFLNSIIHSNDENIALLRQAQIIVSEYDDEELDSMFHDLANAICGSRRSFENVPNCGPFENVLRQISEEYCKFYSFKKHMLWIISFKKHVLWIISLLLLAFALLISFKKYVLWASSFFIIRSVLLVLFALLIMRTHFV